MRKACKTHSASSKRRTGSRLLVLKPYQLIPQLFGDVQSIALVATATTAITHLTRPWHWKRAFLRTSLLISRTVARIRADATGACVHAVKQPTRAASERRRCGWRSTLPKARARAEHGVVCYTPTDRGAQRCTTRKRRWAKNDCWIRAEQGCSPHNEIPPAAHREYSEGWKTRDRLQEQ